MKEVFVVEAARTAVARAGKQSWFMNVRADDLAAIVMKDLRRKIGISEDWEKQKIVGDIYWAATANAFGEQGGNMGRNAWLLSGGSYDVPGMTVDRFCASSLTALVTATATMGAGWSGEVAFAGGAQHMTHIPMGAGSDRNPEGAKYYNPMSPMMGWTAEQVARKYNISREIQDQFAYESHAKCAAAQDANDGLGKTKDVVVPIKCKVPVKSAYKSDKTPEALYTAPEGLAKKRIEEGITDDVEMVVWQDQGLRRDTTIEGLAKMPAVFMKDDQATVTAGNSSQINDAAAGLVLATSEGCKALGVKPRMKLISSAVVGVDPQIMGVGPSLAIPVALKRAGLTADQIGLWEVNEAFASQAYYCCHDALKLPMDRVNVWGSGISIGHPLACTGARIACDITALFDDPAYSDVEYIVESMCIGMGMGAAAVWQRVK